MNVNDNCNKILFLIPRLREDPMNSVSFVCQFVHMSVRPFVRPSVQYLKIGSFVFLKLGRMIEANNTIRLTEFVHK